jgi:hypothetical protein
MEAVRLPAPAVVALAQHELPEPSQALALRRIDCLLDVGAQLAALPDRLDDEESEPGRLPGSFYMTRLPLLLKQLELSLSALRALGGCPPQTAEGLIADPELFRHHGTSLIIAALAEVDTAIRSESLAPRPPARLQSAE